MSEYLRRLNCGKSRDDLPMWQEEGDILITPEGFRWRIERTPTVADLLHVGDVITTSYDTGGLVISLHRYSVCCCPRRVTSSVLFCHPSWDEPAQTLKYHREVTAWSLVYVRPGAPQTKAGKFSVTDYCYINEMVSVGNRILMLYEANEEEIFATNQHIEIKPMQLAMFE